MGLVSSHFSHLCGELWQGRARISAEITCFLALLLI